MNARARAHTESVSVSGSLLLHEDNVQIPRAHPIARRRNAMVKLYATSHVTSAARRLVWPGRRSSGGQSRLLQWPFAVSGRIDDRESIFNQLPRLHFLLSAMRFRDPVVRVPWLDGVRFEHRIANPREAL